MSRSSKKGPYFDERLLAKVERQQRSGNREPIKTWSRDCTIVPDFVGQTFLVHNGRQFMKLYVTEDMVGHKLGEFAPTRTFRGHSGGKGKAGRKRHMGRKPHNRGTSMNPVSHPLGGGEGRSKGGRHPCSPTGVLAKGGKTRKKRKPSNAAIIRRRRPGPHYMPK